MTQQKPRPPLPPDRPNCPQSDGGHVPASIRLPDGTAEPIGFVFNSACPVKAGAGITTSGPPVPVAIVRLCKRCGFMYWEPAIDPV